MYIRWVTFGSTYTSALLGEYLLDDTGAFSKTCYLHSQFRCLVSLRYHIIIIGFRVLRLYYYSNSLIFTSSSLHHQNFKDHIDVKKPWILMLLHNFFINLCSKGGSAFLIFLFKKKIFREVDGGCGHWFLISITSSRHARLCL